MSAVPRIATRACKGLVGEAEFVAEIAKFGPIILNSAALLEDKKSWNADAKEFLARQRRPAMSGARG